MRPAVSRIWAIFRVINVNCTKGQAVRLASNIMLYGVCIDLCFLSPSPAPFTPSFLNSLNDIQKSTPRSQNQVPSRAQRHHSQTTPVISRRQRSFTSASSNSRQTTPSTPSTSSFLHPSASFTSISSSKRSRTPASASREHQRCCKELINNVHQFNRVQFAVLFGTLLD